MGTEKVGTARQQLRAWHPTAPTVPTPRPQASAEPPLALRGAQPFPAQFRAGRTPARLEESEVAALGRGRGEPRGLRARTHRARGPGDPVPS